jgi:hypothetical protein
MASRQLAHGFSAAFIIIRGIQSRRFGRDPAAVSQSFLVIFVSSETALNRPATLNVSFHFTFLVSVSQHELHIFNYIFLFHILCGHPLVLPPCPGRLTARNDVIDYSEVTISFVKAVYSVLEGALDGGDAPYMLLATLKTWFSQACLRHRFLQLILSHLARTPPQTLQNPHQNQA